MKGDVAAELAQRLLVSLAFHGHEHADAAEILRSADSSVDIGADRALGHDKAPGTAQHHVLTNGRDQIGHGVGHGLAMHRRRAQGLDVAVDV